MRSSNTETEARELPFIVLEVVSESAPRTAQQAVRRYFIIAVDSSDAPHPVKAEAHRIQGINFLR